MRCVTVCVHVFGYGPGVSVCRPQRHVRRSPPAASAAASLSSTVAARNANGLRCFSLSLQGSGARFWFRQAVTRDPSSRPRVTPAAAAMRLQTAAGIVLEDQLSSCRVPRRQRDHHHHPRAAQEDDDVRPRRRVTGELCGALDRSEHHEASQPCRARAARATRPSCRDERVRLEAVSARRTLRHLHSPGLCLSFGI